MKLQLKEGAGFPNSLLYMLAVIAGVSVANLYYNQPLLDMIRQELLPPTTLHSLPSAAMRSACSFSSRWPTSTAGGAFCLSTFRC